MNKLKVKEMLKKWGPYILVAVIAGAVVNNANSREGEKNRGKGHKNSVECCAKPEMKKGKRGSGSAGDRGAGRRMRGGMDKEAMEGLKKRMEILKEREAGKKDAANQEG